MICGVELLLHVIGCDGCARDDRLGVYLFVNTLSIKGTGTFKQNQRWYWCRIYKDISPVIDRTTLVLVYIKDATYQVNCYYRIRLEISGTAPILL